ncbi:EH domain-binding protein 1-like [Oopsacas minuta]|uniref:EH domain-binding protein 1-like n=1 Tax=Oopsacas minuta TaxID=111878 RepID=A0AAV7JKR7_9METZ|nr:EH domain-binding protein 1-like [Oopsacas minuta]
MAYKLKRIGKKAYKFEYTLTLHSLAIEVSRPKYSPNQVSIAFSRRGKRLFSKLLKWEPSINKPCHGYVVWPEPESITTIVTLYKGHKDKTYEFKEWEVSIIEVTREGKKKCLGRKAINMSEYTGDVIGNNQDLKLRLTPSGRRLKILFIDCSLNSRFIRAGKSTDTDMNSQTSQMSVSGLSAISDMEDLDLADVNDLDIDLNEPETCEVDVVEPSLFSPPKFIKQEDLLAWSKKCVQGYHGASIHNFTTSWRSGLAFSAIIHHFHPELLDYESLEPNDVTGNNKKAFDAASSLGVPLIIRPEQMNEWLVPDRLSVTALIYQLYIRFESETLHPPTNTNSSLDTATTDKHDTHTISEISEHTREESNKKQKRQLPPTPKQTPTISPQTQRRVKEFLSNLDHSPKSQNNKDVFSNYKQEKRQKNQEIKSSTLDPIKHSPFFGRKAERKQKSLSNHRQEQPFIPDEISRNSGIFTESIEMEFSKIDSEFDSHELFDNTLLKRAENELTPSLGRISPQKEKTQFLKEMASIGKTKPQESLLDIVSDPAMLHETKLLRKKDSKKSINPLYSSQESDCFSSSDTSITDPGTAMVPSKLTTTVTASLKIKETIIPPISSRKDSYDKVEIRFDKPPNQEKKKSVKKTVDTKINSTQDSDTGKTKTAAVTKLDKVRARIKSRKKPNRKRAQVKECEVEHTLLLKKYASVSQIDAMQDGDKVQEISDGCVSDQDILTEFETSKHKSALNTKSQSYGSVTDRDKLNSDSNDNEEPSSYSHLLISDHTSTDPINPTSSSRLLDVYNTRIAPVVTQNKDSKLILPKEPVVNIQDPQYNYPIVTQHKDPIMTEPIEPIQTQHKVTQFNEHVPVMREHNTESIHNTMDNTKSNEPVQKRTPSLSEVCHNPLNDSIISTEETDYVAHMQKKLCSMQISIQARQSDLRDRIVEAERVSDTELHDQLLEQWFQLVQQKAQLDNRYDDLILISEARDLSMKEELLRKELEHKMQIDRSIKSREQIWEEEILCGEIVQIGKERKHMQDELNRSIQHDTYDTSIEVKPKPVKVKTENKSKELGWRDKLLNILA